MAFDPGNDPNNRSADVFGEGAPPPADRAALRADPTFGDGAFQGAPFTSWQYVLTADGAQSFYDAPSELWLAGATPPGVPLEGSVVADLATLRALLGAKVDSDDANLDRALSAASEWVYERCMRCDWGHPDVQYAILLLAARLYQRRKTPEGVAQFGDERVTMRLLSEDPDIARLLTLHLEMRKAGIG